MFQLSNIPINSITLRDELLSPQAGGYCAFEGWVRNNNEGKKVEALEYEAFEPLCLKEANLIFREVKQKYNILEFRCVHRIGKCQIGEMAVWVGVSAAHRDDAFKACRMIIDEIKLRLPIWKKEYYVDGVSNWIKNELASAGK